MRMTLLDKCTGGRIMVDPQRLRLRRLRRRVVEWVKVIEAEAPGARLLMVTLTYGDGVAWNARHISDFMRSVRRELGDSLYGYAWVAELQARGAVHYHVLLWVARGVKLSMPDKSGAWKHGMSRVERARGPYYVVKYLSKEGIGGEFPRGCRLFAVVFRPSAPISLFGRLRLRASGLPAYVRDVMLAGGYQWVERFESCWMLGGSLVGKGVRAVPYRYCVWSWS